MPKHVDPAHETLGQPHWQVHPPHRASSPEDASSPYISIHPAPQPSEPEQAAFPIPDSRDLRPAFEVDHFVWPRIVTELIAAAGAQIDHAANRLLTVARHGKKATLVTGCAQGEGRTTMLLCLAKRLAAGGVKSVVVDADFENPMLASALGMTAEVGLAEVARDNLPLSEALVESAEDRLSLLPLLEPTTEQALLLNNRFWPAMIHQLKQNYPIVLIDSGPLAAKRSNDLLSLGRRSGIDAAILLHDEQAWRAGSFAELARRLQALGIEIHGAVQNCCATA